MKYEITGANRNTGADVTITVEARDFRHAEEQANEYQILVSSVREVGENHDSPVPPKIPQKDDWKYGPFKLTDKQKETTDVIAGIGGLVFIGFLIWFFMYVYSAVSSGIDKL